LKFISENLRTVYRILAGFANPGESYSHRIDEYIVPHTKKLQNPAVIKIFIDIFFILLVLRSNFLMSTIEMPKKSFRADPNRDRRENKTFEYSLK